MTSLDQLAAMLQDVNTQEAANAAGVSTKTIYRLRHGETNPSIRTVEALVAFCKAQKRGKRKPARMKAKA
jgi:DNA-binding XRE family transcriptional regulator